MWKLMTKPNCTLKRSSHRFAGYVAGESSDFERVSSKTASLRRSRSGL
jgi:hypothetical protein